MAGNQIRGQYTTADFDRVLERPLFLHFLNRELAESVGVTFTPASAETIVKTLLLASTAWLYTGLSVLWESPATEGSFLRFVGSLIAQDSLDVLSNVKSQGEFLTSRQARYGFDRQRYPMYFVPHQTRARAVLAPSHVKSTSATTTIETQLRSWADRGNRELQKAVGLPMTSRITSELTALLDERGDRAITGALIEPRLSRLSNQAPIGPMIRRQLAMAFTADYLDSVGGEIPTGIRGLSEFDTLAQGFPVFDVPLLRLVLDVLGLTHYLVPGKHQRLWDNIAQWRNSGAHSHFSMQMYCAISALAQIRGASGVASLQSRVAIAHALRAAASRTRLPRSREATLDYAWIDMTALVNSLAHLRGFSERYERLGGGEAMAGWDLLLITATPVETSAVLKQLGTAGTTFHGRSRTYIDIGLVGDARIALVQCETGSVSPGASQSTAYQAITELRPQAVVLLGIAFGMDPTKQVIGQVLVSKQLELYEPARLGYSSAAGAPVTLPRGDRATASPKLLSRFRAHSASSDLAVTFGLLISGEKLLDNPDAIAALRQAYPEAIGGEMEGAGVYSAARERGVDWIVVKAICDWADGAKKVRKKSRQALAAANAARFVLSCVKAGGFGVSVER
jgi:nucleoside phosphorylase